MAQSSAVRIDAIPTLSQIVNEHTGVHTNTPRPALPGFSTHEPSVNTKMSELFLASKRCARRSTADLRCGRATREGRLAHGTGTESLMRSAKEAPPSLIR